ncbi:DUF5675 family protein [Agrobacterium tumefaciens]|uniref:DUF5675 domain-containing protein n=1 Tax=Agrobacterium tumefaciens TaxID=358 RepID=A0A176WW59_AGRTU|nr:DUF5675 family protein [Agrobacterium tumefaciens]OAE37632.1 hypothetical protein A7J57_08625 [Agrobacterium tumefaciens]
MKTLKLTRHITANGAVVGRLAGLSKPIYTLEDEWRNNARGSSAIPVGTYRCVPHGWEPNSPVKFKRVWHLLGVPGRDAILIHAGNTHKDTLGCILPGLGLQITQLQSMVTDSRMAIDLMRAEIGQNEFMLTIA